MTELAAYVNACRNFLLYRTQAQEVERVVLLYHAERRQMATRFGEAADSVSVRLDSREMPCDAAGAALLEAIRRLTGDIDPDRDSLVFIRSNSVSQGLMADPGMRGISDLLAYCRALPGAHVESMIDPIDEAAFVRMYDIDFGELAGHVKRLRAALEQTRRIEVDCPLGTQIALTPRHWLGHEHAFELYTAPIEDSTCGRIAYCSLSAPDEAALIATVESGRITALQSARGAGKVTESLRRSLDEGDPCRRVVAELGIGTNPGAQLVDSFAGQMENETVRGTCHFDLGANTMFGGTNECDAHLMGLVWRPTIAGEKGVILEGARLVAES